MASTQVLRNHIEGLNAAITALRAQANEEGILPGAACWILQAAGVPSEGRKIRLLVKLGMLEAPGGPRAVHRVKISGYFSLQKLEEILDQEG